MFHLFYDCTKSAFDTSQQILQHFKQTKVLYIYEPKNSATLRSENFGGMFLKIFCETICVGIC